MPSELDTQMAELQAIMDASPLPANVKGKLLIDAIAGFAPGAQQTAEQSAGGSFLAILMQLLIQFLPILLRLLGGGV